MGEKLEISFVLFLWVEAAGCPVDVCIFWLVVSEVSCCVVVRCRYHDSSPTVTPADPIPCRPSDSRPPLQTPPARKLSDFHRMGRSSAERIHCPPAPSRRAGASRRGAAAEPRPWRPRKVLFKGNTMNEVEERDREVEEREDERHSDDIGRLLSICNEG